MNTLLRVTIEETAPDMIEVRCEGDVDLGTASEIDAAVARSLVPGVDVLALDLTGVAFFDSTGIKTLVDCHRRCRAAGVRLEVATNPTVERVLSLVGFRSATHTPGGVAHAEAQR